MIIPAEAFNDILGIVGIVLLVGTSVLIVDCVSSRVFANSLKRYGLHFAFLLVLSSVVVALYYSEILKFIPCGLCWFQRIFLFSQLFILGTALYFKDQFVDRHGIVLSASGMSVALYQHYLQMGGSELIACPTAGVGADCSARYFFEFGFMTYPLLSASLFLFLIALYSYRTLVKN